MLFMFYFAVFFKILPLQTLLWWKFNTHMDFLNKSNVRQTLTRIYFQLNVKKLVSIAYIIYIYIGISLSCHCATGLVTDTSYNPSISVYSLFRARTKRLKSPTPNAGRYIDHFQRYWWYKYFSLLWIERELKVFCWSLNVKMRKRHIDIT